MSGQRQSDGNIELIRFLDSHGGDGVHAVFTSIRLLYRNNTCHDCNTRVFHQRYNRPGGHQQSITLERATLV